jgi:Zn-dependent protease
MEAWVGYGGPFLGGLAAFCCFLVYLQSQETLFLYLAYTGFFLNLFNLIPIHPLDGGRITGALSKWFWVIGWVLGLGWFIMGNHHPLMLIILLMGGFKIFASFFRKQDQEDPTYYAISGVSRAWIALAYFSLVIVLSFMSLHTDALIQNHPL